MTDEEMAEEQVKKWDSILYPELYPVALVKDFIRKAFIAGLEAGRPKWHDLRKDPNDLPKVNQKVLLQIKDEGRPIIDFYTRYGVWNFTNEYEAIAWCEIPKYTEG